ncbi:MAG TPA: DinB family protein [Candidatus Acidoferrum sp.]|nr:DinB family protein [Candidatus Acidoferrum sp.]
MPEWATRLIAELDSSDEHARKLLSELSEQQLNWQPAEGAWSIGQCLEHLCKTNDVYLSPIAQALEGKPKKSVAEITPGWFGAWFIRSFIEPSPNQKRGPAPAKIVPAPHVTPSVLERFLTGNDEARKLIQQASECDVNRIRFRNPFIPVIRFTVGTGFEIVTKHQKRHLLQAERVKEAASFPK